MIDVTSLEVSKELFKISGWDDTRRQWWVSDNNPSGSVSYTDGQIPVSKLDPPAYDLYYLFDKLPTEVHLTKFADSADNVRYQIIHDDTTKHFNIVADTSVEAAAHLCIELIRQGVLK